MRIFGPKRRLCLIGYNSTPDKDSDSKEQWKVWNENKDLIEMKFDTFYWKTSNLLCWRRSLVGFGERYCQSGFICIELILLVERMRIDLVNCLEGIMFEGLHFWRASCLKGFMFDGFMFEGLNVFMFGGYRVWRWKSMVFMSEELHVGRASCLKVLNGHWTSADNCPRRFGADGESHTHTPVWPDKFIKVKLKTAFWSLFGPDRMNRYPCWFRKLFELSWIEIDCIISWLNWRADMCTWRARMSRLPNWVTWFSIPVG